MLRIVFSLILSFCAGLPASILAAPYDDKTFDGLQVAFKNAEVIETHFPSSKFVYVFVGSSLSPIAALFQAKSLESYHLPLSSLNNLILYHRNGISWDSTQHRGVIQDRHSEVALFFKKFLPESVRSGSKALLFVDYAATGDSSFYMALILDELLTAGILKRVAQLDISAQNSYKYSAIGVFLDSQRYFSEVGRISVPRFRLFDDGLLSDLLLIHFFKKRGLRIFPKFNLFEASEADIVALPKEPLPEYLELVQFANEWLGKRCQVIMEPE